MDNFVRQGGMQPQNSQIYINLDKKLPEIKHFLAHQMQNFLWQADVQPPKIILYTYTFRLK